MKDKFVPILTNLSSISYRLTVPSSADFVRLIVEVECLYDRGSINNDKGKDVDKVL